MLPPIAIVTVGAAHFALEAPSFRELCAGVVECAGPAAAVPRGLDVAFEFEHLQKSFVVRCGATLRTFLRLCAAAEQPLTLRLAPHAAPTLPVSAARNAPAASPSAPSRAPGTEARGELRARVSDSWAALAAAERRIVPERVSPTRRSRRGSGSGAAPAAETSDAAPSLTELRATLRQLEDEEAAEQQGRRDGGGSGGSGGARITTVDVVDQHGELLGAVRVDLAAAPPSVGALRDAVVTACGVPLGDAACLFFTGSAGGIRVDVEEDGDVALFCAAVAKGRCRGLGVDSC